ncbi:MAG: SurA N-terminal domain-containing protein [Campylobacterales bacterium]|nr:SurA N-terminal domain-containing protein [Campylobacterales bacterium]
MITWMQRHRKYLVITIWISTIAFIGAGFVGWGQYDYGDKAGAVAKVGKITITQEELQKNYSNLFNQYNQMFQGKLDEKKAKEFGLQRQALKNLVDQSLILNLAASYQLQISDAELFDLIKTQKAFTKNGQFDKQQYTDTLKQNHLTIKEYETSMRRELLIQKTLYLFSPRVSPLEGTSIAYAMGVADKIDYKVLTPDMLTITSDETALKGYWEKNKNNYKKVATYDLSLVHQPLLNTNPNEADINSYYQSNMHSFTSNDGKLLELAQARSQVIAALNDGATQKEALRRYIDFKKGSLSSSVTVEKINISSDSKTFSPELLKEIMALNTQKAFLKPRKVNNEYVIIKFEKLNPSVPKTYEEAKAEANIGYTYEMKKAKLQELAQNSFKTFQGTVSDFITRKESTKLVGLTGQESTEFVNKLFASKQKQGFLTLESGNVILYNVLEQKLLQDTTIADDNTVMKLKGNLLNQKLLKMLESKYPIEIYAEGI